MQFSCIVMEIVPIFQLKGPKTPLPVILEQNVTSMTPSKILILKGIGSKKFSIWSICDEITKSRFCPNFVDTI